MERVLARRRTSSRLLLVATVLGLGHAAVSAYWALGGDRLLATVGTWAVELHRESPGTAALILSGVVVAKLVAVALPIAWHQRRVDGRAPRWLSSICWVEAIVLAAYGGLNSVTSWLVLSHVIPAPTPHDRRALLGHAWLWDPWFLVWGLVLAAFLVSARRSTSLSMSR